MQPYGRGRQEWLAHVGDVAMTNDESLSRGRKKAFPLCTRRECSKLIRT